MNASSIPEEVMAAVMEHADLAQRHRAEREARDAAIRAAHAAGAKKAEIARMLGVSSVAGAFRAAGEIPGQLQLIKEEGTE